MSIRFAGSRTVDERRRRRLAQEAEPAPNAPAPKRPARSERTTDEQHLPRGSSPADTLISPKLWKHALIGVACLFAWAALIGLGDYVDQSHHDLAGVVGLEAGHLARFFSTVMLLAAGQLALISLWYRSRSRKDFNGSYKVWFYAAVGWLTICAFAATGSHWNLADAVLAQRPLAIWNGRLLMWMIPGGIVMVALYRLLLREMRDCRGSLWFLRLSGAAALAAATVRLLGPFFIGARLQLPLEVGSGAAWHMLLAMAMLLHTRHVIHVCNEPPRSPIRRWKLRMPQLSNPFRGLRKRSKSGARAKAAGKAAEKSTKSRAIKARKTTTTRKKKEIDAETADDGIDASPLASAAEPIAATPSNAKAGSGETKTDRPASAARQVGGSAPIRRVDPPQSAAPRPHSTPSARPAPARDADEDDEDSEESSPGLSKKDRRRQQKLQRPPGAR